MKINIFSILLLVIISLCYSQTEYIHGPTQASFYETNLRHTIYIDNVEVDGLEASIAEYNTDTAPTNDLSELLNPLNPDSSDAIFIYYSPNPGIEVCVGWTYYHKNASEKTVLSVYGDDLFIDNNPLVSSSYPTSGAEGSRFSFKFYDADANEFGDIDILNALINGNLLPYSQGSQTVDLLYAENQFGCEVPEAFNDDGEPYISGPFTAPCSSPGADDSCIECGFPVTNFPQITGYRGNDVFEDIDCDLNSEDGNNITLYWETPETFLQNDPNFEGFIYIIGDEFDGAEAGQDTVRESDPYFSENKFIIEGDDYNDPVWGKTISVYIYAWNGYEGQFNQLSFSGCTELEEISEGSCDYKSNRVEIQLCEEPKPNKPQNFSVTAGEGQTTLYWEPPSNGHTQSYNIYRNDLIEPISVVPSDADSVNGYVQYIDEDLESDRSYDYYVKAVNSVPQEGESTDTISAKTFPMNKVQNFSLNIRLQGVELNWELPDPYDGQDLYNYTVYQWLGNGINSFPSDCDPLNAPCNLDDQSGYCRNNPNITSQAECEASGREWKYDYQCVSFKYYFENDGFGNEEIEYLWNDINGDGLFQQNEEVFEEIYNCRKSMPVQPTGIQQTRLIVDDLDDSEFYCFSVIAKHEDGSSEHSEIICGKPQPLFNWQIKIDVELEVSNTYSIYDTSNIIGSSGGNGMWDPNEDYDDSNFNGQYDQGELFNDIGATDGYDPRFDLPEPMTPPNQWVQLYFPHENEGMWQNSFNLDKFTQDIRELDYYQSNPRTWLGQIVTDSPGELKISFDIKTEVDSISNVDEDTLKFFTFIRGDFVDDPVLVLDQLVIDGHSGVHMSNGDCPFTLNQTENELCNEIIDELFVEPMDTVEFAITVGYKPPQPRQGLSAVGDYRRITIFWDEPDECCSTDDGIFPPENYDIFRNSSIFEEDTTLSMIMDGLEVEYYVDIGDDIDFYDDWYTDAEIAAIDAACAGGALCIVPPEDPRRLLDETEYFYNVRGNNVAGSGPFTAEVSVITGENRNPIAIISQSNGLGIAGDIQNTNVDTVFTQIPHNGLGDLNEVSIFFDASESSDQDEPKDVIEYDWNLLDGDSNIDFDNSESQYLQIVVRNQFDTDTNYYHLELIVKDTYYRGAWDAGQMNIIADNNSARDTVVIVVAPERNQAPVADILIEYGDYLDDGSIENSLFDSEQKFDIMPIELYTYLTIDQSILASAPHIWIPPHDGDPNTDWAKIGFRGFGEEFVDANGNGYMDLNEVNTEEEEYLDIDLSDTWTYASKDADDFPNTDEEYWGVDVVPEGGLHDTLYFDWLIGNSPEVIVFDTPPLGEYNESDDYIDANNNGFWDAGDPYRLQDLTIYRQPGIYDISLVVRDDYYYRDTTSFKIHVLPEFNQIPNVRLGNFHDDRLSYHLPVGEQSYFIKFPLDTTGCTYWYGNDDPDFINEYCGYPYGTIIAEPFIDTDGNGVLNDNEIWTDLYPNGEWDKAIITLYDSDNIPDNNMFYDTLLVHEISDADFWEGPAINGETTTYYDELQYRWYVDGVLRGEEETFGYDLGIGTHEVVVDVIDPYGSFDSLKTSDTVTVYISMEPPPAPVIAGDADLTEDLYYIELTWLESEFNNENNILGIQSDNWPFGFPQISENAHIATEYKIFRKRPGAQNPIEAIYTEVATLNIDSANVSEYFESYTELSGRKRFTYIDDGLLPGENYCYQIKPANSHGQLAGNMVCGANCDNPDSEKEICVETVNRFEIDLSNFTEPHIISSFEYDSIGYKIGNDELQFIESDAGINEIITTKFLCDQYEGIWNTNTQECELDPRPFLNRIDVAFKSEEMNGHDDWVSLIGLIYKEEAIEDSFYTYLDMDGDLSVDAGIDRPILNGHIGYILNDSLNYVQMFAMDGNQTDDYLYSEFLPDTDGNFSTLVTNDDILFRFRLYDKGDFIGSDCGDSTNQQSCIDNTSCKWLSDEAICDNYFYEEFTSSPLIVTSDSLIHPLWSVGYDPFENNVGAAGAKFMFGLPFDLSQENILLNESFRSSFIDSDILENEFNDEWLITDDLGTSGNPLVTGQANILWLQYHNLLRVGGETVKKKSIPITEGWNLLTNPLVSKIHKASLKFILPSDENNCSLNSEEECENFEGCVWDLISEESTNSICKSAITWEQAVENGIVSSSLNTWNSVENRYDDVNILQPFNGYWIHVGDLNNDDEITQNGIDNTARFYIFYKPSLMPSQDYLDDLDDMDWRFKLRMKPRRIDNALDNQYGGDYIEVGLSSSGIVESGFKYGEDEHNLKAFPTLTYPGDLFIQRVDWADSLLVPDNLRFYKDYREIIYNWDEFSLNSGCADLDTEFECESSQNCVWDSGNSSCRFGQEGAYVWNLTAIIGNASNVGVNTTRDWIVKFEWNLNQALNALSDVSELPDSSIFQLQYVKMTENETGEEFEVERIEAIDLNSYPLVDLNEDGINDECIASEPGNVCIEIPFNNMLKLENMSVEDTYTWNIRIVLGSEIELAYFGDQDELNTDLSLPKSFEFSDAFPNPFNPKTSFDFSLPRSSTVNIEVFNVLGQSVLKLIENRNMNAGYHSITLDGSSLSSGVYIVRAQLGDRFRKVNKVILFK